jgi:actin-related protein 5
MKAGYDARLRARAEKLKEQEERDAELRREEEDRGRDPVKWAARLRQAHQVCINLLLIGCIQWLTGTEFKTT